MLPRLGSLITFGSDGVEIAVKYDIYLVKIMSSYVIILKENTESVLMSNGL